MIALSRVGGAASTIVETATPVRQSAAAKPALTGIAAEGLSSASVQWPDAPEIKLVKDGGEWKLTAPVTARVDRFEALNFGNLATSEVKETPASIAS